MRSSSGVHYVALDHVRAAAAFLVFGWHFIHGYSGNPVPFEGAPALFPLALLDEGHTGVALFMTLSGFLFAKLLDGRGINYREFLFNRAIRLLPLLVFVVSIIGVKKAIIGEDLAYYALRIFYGIIKNTLPNGGWSITVEFHFYVLLPVLLALTRKNIIYGASVILSAIILRAIIYAVYGEVQTAAYWYIFGRLDQFMLGIIAAKYQYYVKGKHAIMLFAFIIFSSFYWAFDAGGGFYKSPVYPSPSPLWIVMPTIEGAFYALAISWYDGSFSPSRKGLSGFISKLGEFSYSIYLLHFFFVFYAAEFIHNNIMDISNFYIATIWALLLFPLMIIPGFLSFHLIERPFLKLRKSYIVHKSRSEACA
ncbi:acyltransferase family protein [Amphiplicatus metriothermophilus]|uniref:Peptidoglycan/LPS O-acetylase OafA/YrhL, contains acyltransferase and SGNH-hydrolase domains n=1 Tax=Amphiplicatus metriothermophilus TaxID=1519374 RepID=A0A239PII0_9PROT|nr:acyltransferase [Amphiplicatus metriothermophilus]MBB5518070.1 peptidoglycan/LPS O-acetylase OafA/YrhL [Amphiplicatus metriothermophilus]SNT67596.1 Peptidoglycan/LPS O-acetylase OafA/YrhL, contains acyltransferase and SGNH-hydrolase domains [Amphiplicatus metriothermophilus]